jgi:hypothetical protein
VPVTQRQQRTANACATPSGSCPLAYGLPEGSPCYCPTPFGAFNGMATVAYAPPVPPPTPPPAWRCATQYGVCPLGQALPSGSPCYCPTYYGPVWGRAQ